MEWEKTQEHRVLREKPFPDWQSASSVSGHYAQ